jgi:hypothetical protein
VNVLDLDVLVPVDEPLIETSYAGFIDDVQTGAWASDAQTIAQSIGEHIASLVEDGSTARWESDGFPTRSYPS